MSKPIHPATVKRATRLGVQLVGTPDSEFRLAHGTKLSVLTWAVAREALDAFEAGGLEWERTNTGKCGVMVAAYHDRYEHNPHGPGCGDGLDVAMRDAFTDPENGVNVEALRAFGEGVGLWNPDWKRLNRGMQRMNLTNRVRAWLRNHDEPIKLNGTTSRFGVAYSPAGRKLKRAA